MNLRRLVLVGAVACTAAAAFADLSVGLMPAENSIPLVVAARDGLFAAEGVKVTLVPFSGQLERETALQAGAVDGTVSDLVNAIQGWAHRSGAKVASVTEGGFALLTAPGSGLRTMADVAKLPGPLSTGLLENSLVYYLSEKMLALAHVEPSKIDLVPIVQLPARLEMLLAGRIQAACLPEPLATLGESRGAARIVDTSSLSTTPGVLLFTSGAIARKAGEIASFYRAYDRAVANVNRRPEDYRQAIVQGCDFPPAVAAIMRIPRFSPAHRPAPADVDDVARWMKSRGLVTALPSYAELVWNVPGVADVRAP